MNVSESDPNPPLLAHERLDVWRVAVALDQAVVAIAAQAPRGLAWVTDQGSRAAGSAVLNLAEAMGREGADRARMLRIARGSALEVDAALTLLTHRKACGPAARSEARVLIGRLVAMLTRLAAVASGRP